MILLAGIAIGAGHASTVVLENGVANDLSDGTRYEGTADAYLFEDMRSTNFGGPSSICVGNMSARGGTNRRMTALLRFDLSSLAGARATGPATLSLTQVGGSGDTGQGTFEFKVYEIVAKNADWIPGKQGGVEGLIDEPTWDFKAMPSTPWAGSPGLNEPGTDHETEPVAAVTYKESDGTEHVVQIQIPASLIQKWIDHPESNGGLLFVWEAGDRILGQFRSADFPVNGQRPRLQIDYKK